MNDKGSGVTVSVESYEALEDKLDKATRERDECLAVLALIDSDYCACEGGNKDHVCGDERAADFLSRLAAPETKESE